MSFTVPLDAPVCLAGSSTGRPLPRSTCVAHVTATYLGAASTSPVARSSVYWKPFLLNVTSALRVLPPMVTSARINVEFAS